MIANGLGPFERQAQAPDTSWCRPGGSRGYVLTDDLHWPIGRKGSKHIEAIPAGFEFESSVPKALHWVWSPDDPSFLLSAAVHDWLLEAGYDRDFCDSQWLAAARKSGANRYRAKAARIAMLIRRLFLSDHRGITWKT